MSKEANKWYCIGTSGATVDGRNISADTLIEAAEAYNTDTYTAVLKVEHYRPFYPKSELSGLGIVTALKAETENGKTKLYAQLELTDKAVQMLKGKEKIFTSMELVKNFADTNKGYLVGLALTDSPASLGTSMLKFSATAETELLSQYTEMVEKMSENKKGFWAKLHDQMFAKQEPETTVTEEPNKPQSEEYAALREELDQAAQIVAALVEENKKSAEAFAELKKQFDEFKEKIEATPVNGQAVHTGGVTAKSAF